MSRKIHMWPFQLSPLKKKGRWTLNYVKQYIFMVKMRFCTNRVNSMCRLSTDWVNMGALDWKWAIQHKLSERHPAPTREAAVAGIKGLHVLCEWACGSQEASLVWDMLSPFPLPDFRTLLPSLQSVCSPSPMVPVSQKPHMNIFEVELLEFFFSRVLS